MATISFISATCVYPGASAASVDDLCLEVEDGEFMVLVGPSGCGKTTALRMIAGLEEVTEGEIRDRGRATSTHVDPGERDIAMVFQNYALYPAYDRRRQHRLPAAGQGRESQAEIQRARRADGRDPRPRRNCSSASPGRSPAGSASASRWGARSCAQPQRVPDGRAALQPRREAAGPDAGGDRRLQHRARRDDDLRHPRPGRGDDDGNRVAVHAHGRAAAGSAAADAVRPPRQRVRRRRSSARRR